MVLRRKTLIFLGFTEKSEFKRGRAGEGGAWQERGDGVFEGGGG